MATKAQVLALRDRYPNWTAAQIARELGCMPEYVRATISRDKAGQYRILKRPGAKSTWTEQQTIELFHMRDIEKMSWAAIAKKTDRPVSTCSAKYRVETETKRQRHEIDRPRHIPMHILADAIRRNAAERSITAFVLGDPAPGQSALDKRMACNLQGGPS